MFCAGIAFIIYCDNAFANDPVADEAFMSRRHREAIEHIHRKPHHAVDNISDDAKSKQTMAGRMSQDHSSQIIQQTGSDVTLTATAVTGSVRKRMTGEPAPVRKQSVTRARCRTDVTKLEVVSPDGKSDCSRFESPVMKFISRSMRQLKDCRTKAAMTLSSQWSVSRQFQYAREAEAVQSPDKMSPGTIRTRCI